MGAIHRVLLWVAVGAWPGLIEAADAGGWLADVCVYGGTPGGIVAAVAAAREGASVVLVEPTAWIGGVVAGGLTQTDVGNQKTIGGYTREFFARAAARYGGEYLWYAEPHANMETFEAMLRESRVTVVRRQRLAAVETVNGRIRRFSTTAGGTFEAEVYVDASYEGDLMAQCGVGYVVGRESRQAYDEPLAGYYPMPLRPRTAAVMASVCSCLGGEGPHYAHGTPLAINARDDQGRLLWGIGQASGSAGSADGLTQSYNFRLVVTQRPEIRVPFPKPKNYRPERYELLLRLIEAYGTVPFGRLVHLGKVAGGKFDLNAQGLFSTDYVGGNFDYPDGDYATRDRIWQDHLDYVQGFLWYLGHDPRVPASLRGEVQSWGLAGDEFTDNNHWPYALYVREARRMVGRYVMTQKDCQTEIIKPDSVAMGSFVIDCHLVQRIVAADGTVTDEGAFPDAPARPYQIPYRAITPHQAEAANLLVPVCLSASHVAYCSLRMEPVYMALGQASGVAAAMAARAGQAVQAIDVGQLRGRLLEQQAVLELAGLARLTWAHQLDGIVLDDDEAQLTGLWSPSAYGNPINGSGRHDGDSGKGEKSARFVLSLAQSGRYEVRLAYSAAPNRAGKVPVTVAHADGTATVFVNEKLPPPLEGRFVSLGVYRFTAGKPAVVELSNKGTQGHVALDAVQLLPLDR